MQGDLFRELTELTRLANRAAATIYTIDLRGLVSEPTVDQGAWLDYVRESQARLRVLAEETGGVAIENRTEFDLALGRLDAEAGDYYGLGYYSSIRIR